MKRLVSCGEGGRGKEVLVGLSPSFPYLHTFIPRSLCFISWGQRARQERMNPKKPVLHAPSHITCVKKVWHAILGFLWFILVARATVRHERRALSMIALACLSDRAANAIMYMGPVFHVFLHVFHILFPFLLFFARAHMKWKHS